MKVLFVSLGCDKNLVDSEYMLGMLNARGFEITDFEEEADVIVINTCSFIHDAKEESINTILQMAEYRTNGSCKALIVTGCLAERYRDEVLQEIPEVDAVIGTNSTEELLNAIDTAFEGEKFQIYHSLDAVEQHLNKRLVTTGGHYAYLKIAEGCEKNCTYCIIPKIRGKYRSVSMDVLLGEAVDLAKQGVKELILVAQETTLYGVDLYGEKTLPKLLDALNQVKGIRWIRLLYCYPEEIDDELIAAIKRNDKVCHYIDMPIQHINDTMLRRMGRRTSKAELEEKIAHIRQEIPDIALRTTLICGFPGETEEMHDELMGFVNETEFDRLGAFTYSQEDDTPAASFDHQIDEEMKLTRKDNLMELQQEVAFDKNETLIGSTMLVMIEGQVADENTYIGRTYRDAPGVDGYVFVQTGEVLMSGDFVEVVITAAHEYDLIGELKHEFAK